MKIGVVAGLDRRAGGAYQYAVTMVRALIALDLPDEIVLFTYVGDDVPPDLLSSGTPVVEMRALRARTLGLWALASGFAIRIWRKIRTRLAPRAATSSATEDRIDPLWSRFFRSFGVDVLLFTSDSELASVSGVPFGVVVHDLQFRLNPQFEEVSADGEAELREARVGSAMQHATLVIVDSETGKQDVLSEYAGVVVDPDSVFVLPFLAADCVRAHASESERQGVRARYSLPSSYFFYPAAFWPHKNHLRLVEALARIVGNGHDVDLVFVGSAEGELRSRTLSEVTALAAHLGIRERVHHLGYVPDQDMTALYAEAVGLVMPTFFGPTNIPVIEAWRVGCPVLTSDIRGIREQVGDAGVLVDPESIDSIAEGMNLLLTDHALRARIVERGMSKLESYTPEDYARRLRDAIELIRHRVGVEHRIVGNEA